MQLEAHAMMANLEKVKAPGQENHMFTRSKEPMKQPKQETERDNYASCIEGGMMTSENS